MLCLYCSINHNLLDFGFMCTYLAFYVYILWDLCVHTLPMKCTYFFRVSLLMGRRLLAGVVFLSEIFYKGLELFATVFHVLEQVETGATGA